MALWAAEYVPRGQAKQAACPALGWCLPAAQAEQLADSDIGATDPAPHRVHEAEPEVAEYIPTGQLAQDDDPWYVPAPQAEAFDWCVEWGIGRCVG